jgi:hypothetical protein
MNIVVAGADKLAIENRREARLTLDVTTDHGLGFGSISLCQLGAIVSMHSARESFSSP